MLNGSCSGYAMSRVALSRGGENKKVAPKNQRKVKKSRSLLHGLVNTFYFAEQDFDEPREQRGHDETPKGHVLINILQQIMLFS